MWSANVTMDNPGVSIDTAHASLIYGLVCSQKPTSILEFGFGGGRSADAILRACEFNGNKPRYDLVDNWKDWDGTVPDTVIAFRENADIAIITADEGEFVRDCEFQYEFIMSDADHANAEKWFNRTYIDLLAPGGILVYHDVRNFPNLAEIVTTCKASRLRHVVFDRCSRVGEACQRGLLVIFKTSE